MRAGLHVLVILQCIVFRASCSAFFPPPSSSTIIISMMIVLISPLNSPFSVTSAWAVAAGLVAGLWVGQAFGVLLLPRLRVSGLSPQVPRHPTSMCNPSIN